MAMEPLYYTNAHSDYFKSILKRSKLYGHKERKNRGLITSFLLPLQMDPPFKSKFGGLQAAPSIVPASPLTTSPVTISLSPSNQFPTIILVVVQDYSARAKNELTVQAKEHLKLVLRLGNGLLYVKSIERLSSGVVPVSVVKIVDLDNKVGNDQRQKFDATWLNTPDSTSSPLVETTPKLGTFSVSKPTPIGYTTTPEYSHSYSYKGQFSKESAESVNSQFDHELKRKTSSLTVGLTVLLIHLYTKHPISNTSSPELEDDLENDIHREENEEQDDFLTGFDHEHANVLHSIEDVAVHNVYNLGNRFWYRAEIYFRNGNKRFLRRFYQDFHDLHLAICDSISTSLYIDNDFYVMPKMPGPIPRPDPQNPSKSLIKRCHDLDAYFKQLFLKLAHDGYRCPVFEEWISPRFGDYDTNTLDLATGLLDNSILFERPLKDEDVKLSSPMLATPEEHHTPIRMPSTLGLPLRHNKNLPPIPMSDALVPPTPVLVLRPLPTPNQQFNQLKVLPFTAQDDEEIPLNKLNNDIIQEIESEMLGLLKNVLILQASKINLDVGRKNVNDGYSEECSEASFTQHQISGPQIRVKVFYNDGDDIFLTKVPVSINLAQLRQKIFGRIKNDFNRRSPAIQRKLRSIDDIFLFSKDSNGMYSAIKDDMSLRKVIMGSKGKFSVRVEFD